ncbi:hypothetical protein C8Q74DRAFT_1441657 [Fomes fomentarius]|nr:hypothetical protein C8Q74DRAFT_1441657 [Fomes fomentarius]
MKQETRRNTQASLLGNPRTMMVTLPAAYIVAESSKSRAHREEVPAMQVDDADPSIQYTGDWIQDILKNAAGHSRHGAPSVGLTVSYRFHGGGIEVFGTIGQDSGRPSTQYTIDGQHPTFYTVPHFAATPESQRQFNVSFYSQHGLGPGEHTLTITNVNGTSPNIFWLDYFIVDTPDTSEGIPPPSTSLFTVKSRENTHIGPSSLSTTDVTVTTISDANPLVSIVSGKGTLSQSDHHDTNTAAIVGGITGVLLVIAVVVTFVLIRKRCQGTQKWEDCQPSLQHNTQNMNSDGISPSISITPMVHSTCIESSYTPQKPRSSVTACLLPDHLDGTDLQVTPPQGRSTSPTHLQLGEPDLYDSARTSQRTTPQSTTPSMLLHSEVSQTPWYAPPGNDIRGQAALDAFLGRDRENAKHCPMRDVDSGLRMLNTPALLPPPYTAD